MGSLITVRRSIGGSLRGIFDMNGLLPFIAGVVASSATALSIRWFVDPNTDTTQQTLVKYAPLFGLGAGGLMSAAMMVMGGGGAAVQSFVGAFGVSGALFASDYVLKERAAPIIAALTSSGAAMQPGTAGYGMGAIVPEYGGGNGMGALVMEQMGPGGRRPGSIGSYGEVVSLQGVNVGAFGTAPFRS